MTSRELTSGFDFWSRSHLRVPVMHLSIEFGMFIQSGVIDIFQKLKIAATAILDLLGIHRSTHEGVFVVRALCNISS